jgi:hypothetical protein
MKFRLNKLVAGMALAGSALALVACGGGGVPDLVATGDATVAVGTSTTAVANTQALVTAATGASFDMSTAISFTNISGGTDSTTTVAPTITLTTTTDASATAVADFVMTDGTDVIEGTVDAGSCNFRVKKSKNGKFIVGQIYKIVKCELKALTTGLPVGSSADAAMKLILNDIASSPTTKKITITVTPVTGTNTATIVVNGKTVGTVTLPTGTK